MFLQNQTAYMCTFYETRKCIDKNQHKQQINQRSKFKNITIAQSPRQKKKVASTCQGPVCLTEFWDVKKVRWDPTYPSWNQGNLEDIERRLY